MTNTLLNYFLWAIVQHLLCILPVWFFDIPTTLKVLLSWFIFNLAHIPNYTLMAITSIAGFFIYLTLGIVSTHYGFISVETLYVFLICCGMHGIIGRLLLTLGMDLRVLWAHPKWRKSE
jgi:hypothetical protein